MKKGALLLIGISIVLFIFCLGIVSADVLFSEDFGNGLEWTTSLPPDWTASDDATSGMDDRLSITGGSDGNRYGWLTSGDGETITYYPISTVGYYNIVITYSYYLYGSFALSDYMIVEWKQTSDSSWNNIQKTTGLPGWNTVTFSLPGMDNLDDIELRIREDGIDSGDFILIDSIQILGDGEVILTYCGDGVVQHPNDLGTAGENDDGIESCDDGNLINDDECDNNCRSNVAGGECGDGTINQGEQCDDGNIDNGDGCSSTCTVELEQPVCGNDVAEGDEDCDGVDLNGGTCVSEGFDSGILACDQNCVYDTTGCSIIEEPFCGDGNIDDGEECDDGNFNNHDGCLNDCTTASCGDGYLLLDSAEQCDDGNLNDADSCYNNCTFRQTGECFQPVDVMLVIDRSGSMSTMDNGVTRLSNAKSAAINFINLASSLDHNGLVSFNETAILNQPFSQDKSLTITAINNLVAGGQTNIGDAMKLAKEDILANADHKPVLILLSDGAPNAMAPNGTIEYCVGVPPTACTLYADDQATLAKNAGIEIFTIGIAVNNFTESLLKSIATDNDHYYFSPTGNDLQEIYQSISETLCPCKGFDCGINSDECNEGYCNVETDECEFGPLQLSTVCDTDDDLCTTQHCDGVGACVPLEEVVCGEPGLCEDDNICNPASGQCEPVFSPLSTPCEADESLCTYDHCNGEGSCVSFDSVDCSDNNIAEIDTCTYIPDSINYTLDYFPGFVSVCVDETGSCTTGTINLTHECSIERCDAECDDQHPCDDNRCSEQYNDSCDGLKLVEYDDDMVLDYTTVTDSCSNSCLGDCSCTDCSVDCSAPPTDSYCVEGVCNAECDSNDDCDDDNENTIDTCLGNCSCQHVFIDLIEKDSKVAQAMPTSNFGNGRYMIVNPKAQGTDRSYIRIDVSTLPEVNVSAADLMLAVYYTGNNVVGKMIDAYYCADHDFIETSINWFNQPLDDGCVLADTYNVTNTVIAGLPETWHPFDIADEVNKELSEDGLFTVVLKARDEGTVSDNSEYVQYLTKEYSEEAYRPKLELS